MSDINPQRDKRHGREETVPSHIEFRLARPGVDGAAMIEVRFPDRRALYYRRSDCSLFVDAIAGLWFQAPGIEIGALDPVQIDVLRILGLEVRGRIRTADPRR